MIRNPLNKGTEADGPSFRFAGKEFLSAAGMNLNDFGPRMYDPTIGFYSQREPRNVLQPYYFIDFQPMFDLDTDDE